jgi:DNA-directed RNA polymerase subunit H (RpoH/RPB5)|tara:strand:- start:480 stop:1118 length:639 start_codon:yes stop_codon:yes gene_type:complete
MAQNSSSIISSIYKSRKTLVELMKKQGYKVEEYENFSVNEVNNMYQHDQLDMLVEKEDVNKMKRKLYISYYLEKAIRPNNIEEMIDELFNVEEVLSKDDTLMIITKADMNETNTNKLKHIWEQEGILVIIQNIKRLQFNILDNVLVPSHRVLDNTELLDVKKKFNLIENIEFPEISRFDPVAKVIGIRPGEVCEIIRPSKNSIDGYYYRICV